MQRRWASPRDSGGFQCSAVAGFSQVLHHRSIKKPTILVRNADKGGWNLNSVPIIRHRFETLEELTANVRGWEIDFKQLTADRTASELTQVHLGSLLLTHLSTGCRHVQQGVSPSGAYTFGLLADEHQTTHWCGQALGTNCLVVFTAGQDFEASAHPRFGIYTLTIDPIRIEADPAWRQLRGLMTQRGSSERYLLQSDRTAMARLRRLVSAAHRFSGSDLFAFVDQDASADLGDEIVASLLAVVGAAAPAREPVNVAARAKALRKALEFVRDRQGEPVKLNEMCRSVQVSERTLQRAFLERFGVTPKTYLQALRLNGVRRDLLCSEPLDSLVRDAAMSWGFWHMGQFAADYKRLFGELPSQTLADRPWATRLRMIS